jgi:hypothetical protein
MVPVPEGMARIPESRLFISRVGFPDFLSRFDFRVGVIGPVPGSGAAFAIARRELLASKTRYVCLRNSAP